MLRLFILAHVFHRLVLYVFTRRCLIRTIARGHKFKLNAKMIRVTSINLILLNNFWIALLIVLFYFLSLLILKTDAFADNLTDQRTIHGIVL